ncbi:MAG: Uma2 family endonuclease [Caldilineaceae bacterium]|nr:Uma2 family endonuclease [Caldilineaceae bacterium]
MAAVEVRTPERTLVQTDANGRARERYVDATMTRAAREARIAWRLEHLAAWQHDLESLAHFDPDYPYDVAHEYDHDWTTDPDYGAEGVHFSEFEEDGVLIDGDSRPSRLQERMFDTAQDRIGDRALTEAYYVFVPQRVEHLELATRQGSPVDRVKPDLLVMPTEADLQEAHNRDPDRTAQLDDPVPELVLEVLSKTTVVRDLDDKRRLYEALGVLEYLVYDLGGKRWADSPRELLMWRLEGGVYHRMDPDLDLSQPNALAYRSEVFGTHIRFLPDSREDAEEFRRLPAERRPQPCFQWWDATESRWHDRESDEWDRIAQETRQAERIDQAVATLREFLDMMLSPAVLDLIETTWRRDGLPPNHLRQIKAVLRMPSEWRSLLMPDEPDDAGSPNHTPAAGPT